MKRETLYLIIICLLIPFCFRKCERKENKTNYKKITHDTIFKEKILYKTKIKTKVKTNIQYEKDSIIVYKSVVSDSHWVGNITAKADSTTIELNYKATLTASVIQSQSLFKQNKPNLLLTSNDKRSMIEVNNISRKPKNPPMSVNIGLGYGIGLKDMKPQPFIGINIGYNLIR